MPDGYGHGHADIAYTDELLKALPGVWRIRHQADGIGRSSSRENPGYVRIWGVRVSARLDPFVLDHGLKGVEDRAGTGSLVQLRLPEMNLSRTSEGHMPVISVSIVDKKPEPALLPTPRQAAFVCSATALHIADRSSQVSGGASGSSSPPPCTHPCCSK